MGWAVGYDPSLRRDVGYGVPAICDHPDCVTEIDRGLSYVCGSEPFGGDQGCGLHFCLEHLTHSSPALEGDDQPAANLCERCLADEPRFDTKPDVFEWIRHKLTDESWQAWRDEHPAEVEELRAGTASLVAYWNDDGDSWWFDTGDADDADSTDRFHNLVPAELWETSHAAYKAWVATLGDLQEAMGLGDEGMLEQVCEAWVGTTQPAVPYVSLVVGEGASGMYFGGHATEAEAAEVLAALPEVVYVLAYGKPKPVQRDMIRIEAGERGGYDSSCRRCGHSRGEHADQGQPLRAVS